MQACSMLAALQASDVKVPEENVSTNDAKLENVNFDAKIEKICMTRLTTVS